MKKYSLILILIIANLSFMNAQNNSQNLPYYEIPDHPKEYNQGAIVARMIDGLGFRYFWATEGLRKEDLSFKPSTEARTTEETVDHILSLTQVILNSALHKENGGGEDYSKLTFEEKRRKTLEDLKRASDVMKNVKDLSKFTIVFNRGGKSSEFPFWNQINGPISDAIWHCGQVISFRRSSGNPYNSKASVFTGKVRE